MGWHDTDYDRRVFIRFLLIHRFLLSSGPMLIVLTVGLIQGIRLGFDQKDYACLIIGSLSSTVLLLFYVASAVCDLYGISRPWLASCSSLGEYVPYLFALYLTFYRGWWGVISQFWDFSVLGLLSAAFFLFIGTVAIILLEKLTTESRKAKRFGDAVNSLESE
jgi:hypothetical protein